jgi:hypothetical protein
MVTIKNDNIINIIGKLIPKCVLLILAGMLSYHIGYCSNKIYRSKTPEPLLKFRYTLKLI